MIRALLIIIATAAMSFSYGYSLQPDTHVVERVHYVSAPEISCSGWEKKQRDIIAAVIPISALTPMRKK